ncbi:hypothetical protein F2981_02445 [Sinorhizobium meliloti]|nr:hypothetical protein [Sinorhizobium meliloti]
MPDFNGALRRAGIKFEAVAAPTALMPASRVVAGWDQPELQVSGFYVELYTEGGRAEIGDGVRRTSFLVTSGKVATIAGLRKRCPEVRRSATSVRSDSGLLQSLNAR